MNNKQPKRQILRGYKRKGKKFIHPLIAKLGDTLRLTAWPIDFLPDILMISLLFDQLPERRAVEVSLSCAEAVKSVVGEGKMRAFALISDYYGINDDTGNEIREKLAEIRIIDELRSNISPLVSLYQECPLRLFYDEEYLNSRMPSMEFAFGVLKRVVSDCYDRMSRPAALAQTTVMYIYGMTGTIKRAEGVEIGDLNAILSYPDTSESREIASSSRAFMKILMHYNDNRSKWCEYFWRHGYIISPCEVLEEAIPESTDSDTDALKDFAIITQQYKQDLYDEIDRFWDKFELDLAHPEKDEVLGGLIARQARFATSIATESNLCSFDIGRILMRCMVDTHITIIWLIKKNDDTLYRQFIDYGVGQDKLISEHISDKSDGINAESFPAGKDLFEKLSIDSDYDFSIVNVGHWAGKSTRRIAQEAGCMDVYDLSYSSLSASIHGSWNEISKVNLQHCYNPLHRFHRIPKFEKPPILLDIVDHAALIMYESFNAWADYYAIEQDVESSSSIFRKKLLDLFSKWSNEE